MSSQSKIRVFTLALLISVNSGVIFAAPKQPSRDNGLFGRIAQIVRSIGKILLPTILDDPTFPKP